MYGERSYGRLRYKVVALSSWNAVHGYTILRLAQPVSHESAPPITCDIARGRQYDLVRIARRKTCRVAGTGPSTACIIVTCSRAESRAGQAGRTVRIGP
jgi:hypothetical protein